MPQPEPPLRTVPQVHYAGVKFQDLQGKSVIVNGGASGIGGDIVPAFTAQGGRVGFVDRLVDAGRALAARLPGTAFEACDVSDVPALQAAIGRLLERLGGADVLVNNVANDERHHLEELTPAYFDQRIAINLQPHFFATQAVLPSMRSRGGGSIVNIGSGSWKNKTCDLPVYATAKSAITGFTRSLARELGPQNIRVNQVVPGWVMTERQVSLWLDEAGERAMDENQSCRVASSARTSRTWCCSSPPTPRAWSPPASSSPTRVVLSHRGRRPTGNAALATPAAPVQCRRRGPRCRRPTPAIGPPRAAPPLRESTAAGRMESAP
jgi:D-xylose 1-dehydrogenase